MSRHSVSAGGEPEVDLQIDGGLVVTVDTQRRVLRAASVIVDDGRIIDVDTTDRIRQRYRARRTLGSGRDIVTPGLIDAHVHLSHQLMRSALPDTWPEEREHDVWLPYWRNLSPDDTYQSSLLACLEMVRNGTTTFCDMSGRHDAEVEAAAADAVGMRGIVSEVCWDLPPYPDLGIGDTQACLARLESLVDRFPFSPDHRIWAAVGMSGMGKASDALIRGAAELARSRGLPLYMHQSFAESDTNAFRVRTGRSAVEHLAELGAVASNLQLIHMIRAESTEVPLLASVGASVVHCPGASVRWGLGVSKGLFPEMVAAGVNVALGSDSGNYADFFDVSRQAYLAATIHREQRGLTPTIAAEQAIEMATMNGARALGAETFIGSIEVGKRADVVVHDGARPEWHPIRDVASSWIYAAQNTAVRDVVIDGQVVLESGRFTRLDVVAALAEIDVAAERLWSRMKVDIPRPWPLVSSGSVQ